MEMKRIRRLSQTMASKYKLKTLPKADADVRAALDWFTENRGTKIRDNFFKDYRRTKTKLQNSPITRAPFYKDYCKVRFSKFPYKVIYRMKNDVIYIVAVAHDARDDYWKR